MFQDFDDHLKDTSADGNKSIRCIHLHHRVRAYKGSDEALSGYTAAIAALIGSSQDCPGTTIPFEKSKVNTK